MNALLDTKTLVLFLSASLLSGSIACGASVTGDEFTVELTENDVVLGTTNAVAGAPGLDVDLTTASASLDWLDNDTFEIDFFSLGPLVEWSLTGLDFSDSGSPVDIVGVSKAESEFGWSYTTSVTANSITVVFPSLTGNAFGDGEVISFDVLTSPIPEPTGWLMLLTAVGGLFALRRSVL